MVDCLPDAMSDSDSLLSRACRLLGCEGVPKTRDGLLQAFVAGGVHDVVVCKPARLKSAPATAEAAGDACAVHGEHSPAGASPASTRLEGGAAQEDAVSESQADQTASAGVAEETSSAGKLHVCAPDALPAELQGAPLVYFGCAVPDPSPDGTGSAQQPGEATLTMALPAGPSLSSLRLLLQHVVAPLATHAAQQGGQPAHEPGSKEAAGLPPQPPPNQKGWQDGSDGSGAAARAAAAELVAATAKFAAVVAAAERHARSEVGVELPAVELQDVAAAARSEEAVLACERCMEGWARLVADTLQREAGLRPAGRGPLAELEFWQGRAEVYGGLLEQLSVPAVRATQGVVEAGSLDRHLAASFRAQLAELARLALGARDNARFLRTVERHLRVLADGGLPAVAEALQPLLNALRMIWVVSRYYGNDVHMSSLLERIAQTLQDRLDSALDFSRLFQAPAAEALAAVQACRAVADGWRTHYLATRERIEAEGHHARWEFSKQLLFERTNYAAEVCGEVAGMLGAVDDFRQFLGPELKAVTGDSGVIDEVSVMVQALVEPVEGIAFNPLDRRHAGEWRAVRGRFLRDVDDVKLATRDLIDTCFRRLHSVHAATQLLHSFKRIRTQGAVQQQMAEKVEAVLEHFIRETHSARRAFEKGREQPEVTRYVPPVAGCIRWSRGLLLRLRRTWVLLLGLDGGLDSTDLGRRAAAAISDLSRDLLGYEKSRFAAWSAGVEAAVAAGLRHSVLCRQEAGQAALEPDPASAASPSGGAAVAINFPPALLRTMREAKYLDQLGFAVPPAAVNLALQEGQIREHFRSLEGMLDGHHGALASLGRAERALLREQAAALEAALEPGLSRINWASLTIPLFVADVNKAVEQFGTLVGQVKKNALLIEKAIFHIARASLVPQEAAPAQAGVAPEPGGGAGTEAPPGAAAAASDTLAEATQGADATATADQGLAAEQASARHPGGPAPPAAADVPDLHHFVEHCEQHRQQVLEGVVARYRTVGALLVKVEELVAGTATGKSPRLAGYYAYWEHRAFSAVSAMVAAGLQAMHARMRACGAGNGSDAGAAGGDEDALKPPLFQVCLTLIHSEVDVAPSGGEVTRALFRLLHNLADSAKAFVRWMDGTCREAPEQRVYGEDAETFTFNFFSDVSQSPAVVRAMRQAQQEVPGAVVAMTRVAARWRGFGTLWRNDRQAALAKLRARKLSAAAAEERMLLYHRIGEEALAAGTAHNACFIQVNCEPLVSAVRTETQAWVKGIASMMAEADADELAAVAAEAASLLAAVNADPEDEAGVCGVNEAIAKVNQSAPGMAAACDELEARVRARMACAAEQDVAGMEAELAAVKGTRSAWQHLHQAAEERLARGVSLPEPASVAAPAAEAASRRPSALSQPHASTLSRTGSSVSATSSPSSKGKKQPAVAKKSSRAPPAGPH